MGEYLLEVRSEEIPARMLAPGVKELATRLFEELMARGLGPSQVDTGYTPRRLMLALSGLPEKEPDREEQVLGPPVRAAYTPAGEPTPSFHGFAKKCGVPEDELKKVSTEKGEYLGAMVKTPGRATRDILAELVPRLLGEISWAKTMRWAEAGKTGKDAGPWVRPVHGIVSLLDGTVVPFELFGVAAGDSTEGHPVLSPASFKVTGLADYRRELAARAIEVRPAERRGALHAKMMERAAAAGGILVEDPALLDKLVAICEIPGVMEGGFEEEFLDLPAEVLSTSLRDHQSALTVERAGGDHKLLPCFLTVMDRPDDPAGRVRSGNEWVVSARLADARFFYGEDRKVNLARRAEQLGSLTFHDKLGSYADKSARLALLAGTLCAQLGWQAEAPGAKIAARLLKADLATEMVKEFTSLQGIMGGIYARLEGQPEEVWQAIYDQYLPASTEDAIPRGRIGQVVSLADRIDTLAGIFGLGLVPTGSRDPFGLRRAAQGVVRILVEGSLPLDVEQAVAEAVKLYGNRLTRTPDQVLADLRPFLADRLRHVLGLAGYAYDEIEAGLAAGAANLPDLKARVDALHQARTGAGFLSVVLAAKRIANIVKDAPESPFDPVLLVEPAERDLATAFTGMRAGIEAAAAARDYERCLARIAELAPVLDRFFVEVLVMDKDEAVRTNRIALLQAIGRTVSRTARLTEMVVDRAGHRSEHGAAT
jgi:glycyl-tRNA synthetase beta chain